MCWGCLTPGEVCPRCDLSWCDNCVYSEMHGCSRIYVNETMKSPMTYDDPVLNEVVQNVKESVI